MTGPAVRRVIDADANAIRVVDDPWELAAFFAPDRGAHIYGIADLAEPCWSASTWWRRDAAVVGVVGLPEGDRVVYAVSTEAPAATLELLVELGDEIPTDTLLTGPVGLGASLSAAGRDVVWSRTYHRYVLRDDGAMIAGNAATSVASMGPDDAEELQAFYDSDPGAAFFLPSMLDDDSFVGIRSNGRLIAAAGTHVLDEAAGVAAIGAVLTAPSQRGRGLARTVTVGVWERIRDRVDVIGLNCADRNEAAKAVYRRLGFAPILQYEEAEIRH